MIPSHRLTLIAAGTLVLAGVVRMPVEQALTEELRKDELLQKPLDLELRKKVGQGFWAVSLGGLRTLVATVLHLRAFSYFEVHKWTELADTFDTIVQLAPHTNHYWDLGSWHMAYNAASYYDRNPDDLPAIRARAEKEAWIRRGTAFLEEGVRQNPDDGKLWFQLGWLYADRNKLVDYDKAAEAFHNAVATGRTLPYVERHEAFAMARSGKYAERALPLVRKLLENPRNALPTMLTLRFALEHRENPDIDSEALALELFGSDEGAYKQLGEYFLDFDSGFPMNGVALYLRKLERKLGVPDEESVFKARDYLEHR